MLREKESEDYFIYNFKLEDYVPEDHLLRLIDNHIDFSFIINRIKHLYSHTGRPSIDPVVLIKMLLIGYLYNIKSERQIEKEIQVNLAYRWFIKYNIEESIPDHSTISQTRRRKFSESGIFQEIFDEVVKQIIAKGLINGETIFTDSTHIKANASMESLIEINLTPIEYFSKLDEEADKEEQISEEKSQNKNNKTDKKSNETHISKSDPDAKIMSRPGKPKGLHYLEHRSIDESGYITDSFVTPGNEQDSIPYIDRLLRQRWAFHFKTKNAVADMGYGIGRIYSDLIDLGINAYIPRQQEDRTREGMFSNKDFTYVSNEDYYICPAGNKMTRRSKEPNDGRKHVYSCGSKLCNSGCIFRNKCTVTNNNTRAKTIMRNIYQNEIDIQLQKRKDPLWRRMLKKRRYMIEGSFGDGKVNHGLGYARYRGIKKVQEQMLMIATAQNIKKMIKQLRRIGENISADINSISNYALLIYVN